MTLKENRESLRKHVHIDDSTNMQSAYKRPNKKARKFYEPGTGSSVFGGYMEIRESEFINSIEEKFKS